MLQRYKISWKRQRKWPWLLQINGRSSEMWMAGHLKKQKKYGKYEKKSVILCAATMQIPNGQVWISKMNHHDNRFTQSSGTPNLSSGRLFMHTTVFLFQYFSVISIWGIRCGHLQADGRCHIKRRNTLSGFEWQQRSPAIRLICCRTKHPKQQGGCFSHLRRSLLHLRVLLE